MSLIINPKIISIFTNLLLFGLEKLILTNLEHGKSKLLLYILVGFGFGPEAFHHISEGKDT